MPVPEIARRCAAVIRDRGLHQGDYMPADGNPDTCPVCIFGAVNVVLRGAPNRLGEGPAENAFARRFKGLTGRRPDAFNDDKGCTADTVLVVLDAMAEEGMVG